MTPVFTNLADPQLLAQLLSDGVGVIPTDTVYGLVARAESETAIKKLYSIKSRERQPGTTIAASSAQLESLGFPADALAVASQYWPNAVSVEMSAEQVPEYLKVNQDVMAARVPNHLQLLALLEKTGPLMTTSANAPKEPTSTSVKMAQDYFGDDVDFYVDGGDLSGRAPSTIIGIKPSGELVIYRQGAVTIEPTS